MTDNHDIISLKVYQITVERTPAEEKMDKESFIPSVDNMKLPGGWSPGLLFCPALCIFISYHKLPLCYSSSGRSGWVPEWFCTLPNHLLLAGWRGLRWCHTAHCVQQVAGKKPEAFLLTVCLSLGLWCTDETCGQRPWWRVILWMGQNMNPSSSWREMKQNLLLLVLNTGLLCYKLLPKTFLSVTDPWSFHIFVCLNFYISPTHSAGSCHGYPVYGFTNALCCNDSNSHSYMNTG